MMGKYLQAQLVSAKWRFLLASLFLVSAATVQAAADAPPLVSGPELGLPSVWRVLVGFLVVVVAAVGAAALLRRLKPWVPLAGGSSGTEVLLLSHRQLARNLHVHVIETQRQRFLVVSSPHQLEVTPLAHSASSDELATTRHES